MKNNNKATTIPKIKKKLIQAKQTFPIKKFSFGKLNLMEN